MNQKDVECNVMAGVIIRMGAAVIKQAISQMPEGDLKTELTELHAVHKELDDQLVAKGFTRVVVQRWSIDIKRERIAHMDGSRWHAN